MRIRRPQVRKDATPIVAQTNCFFIDSCLSNIYGLIGVFSHLKVLISNLHWGLSLLLLCVAMTQSFDSPTAPSMISIAQLPSMSDALAVVQTLRTQQRSYPLLQHAVSAIKRLQCVRFQRTYADVLMHPDWAAPAQFFLTELYGDKDFSQRDAQFGRIAPAMQRIFPQSVVGVATALTQLHALTEQLDYAMAVSVLNTFPKGVSDTQVRGTYIGAWREVGQRSARLDQLALVQRLGLELSQLTRTRGLRTMLRMMRGPAHSAGLKHLQDFLELGFDTFQVLQRSSSGSEPFLALVNQRENDWIARLFDTHIAPQVTSGPGIILWPELE
jgi:hypothetical protein